MNRNETCYGKSLRRGVRACTCPEPPSRESQAGLVSGSERDAASEQNEGITPEVFENKQAHAKLRVDPAMLMETKERKEKVPDIRFQRCRRRSRNEWA